MTNQQQIANLKTHVTLIKQMNPEQADEEFYQLMIKAKELLGDIDHRMAHFYYQYANYILGKIEKNIDIFNAAAVPNQEEAEDDPLEQIQEHFEEGSEAEQSGAKSKNNILVHKQDQKVVLEEDGVKITQDKPENAKNPQQNNANIIPQQEQVAEDDDEREICYLNLESALNIYLDLQKRMNNGQKLEYTSAQLLDSISRTRSRLGDLFMINQQYQKAVEQFREVIQQEQKREGADSKRALAELHYLIGNAFLYQNKEGCERIALKEYVKAVNILINHLGLVKNYDICDFQIPNEDQYKVDRFAYLPKPLDGQDVIEIKDVINCLLDKIQDTYDQIGVRSTFEEEKQKLQKEKEKEVFKEISPEVKVIHLGTFGNRKKLPQPTEKTEEESNPKSSTTAQQQKKQ